MSHASVEPTPLLLEHRRLLSSLAAIEAHFDAVTAAGAGEDIPDEVVDALCEELSVVERKILETPVRSRADALARLEVAAYANRGCEDSSTHDDRSVAGLIAAVRMLLKDADGPTATL
jgi:hypothetical protein